MRCLSLTSVSHAHTRLTCVPFSGETHRLGLISCQPFLISLSGPFGLILRAFEGYSFDYDVVVIFINVLLVKF